MPHIVAIGGSAGSIEALSKLLGLLPPSLPAIVLATVHRRVYAESHLKDVLSRRARMRVVVPEEGELLSPGTCYIGHPASHLRWDQAFESALSATDSIAVIASMRFSPQPRDMAVAASSA